MPRLQSKDSKAPKLLNRRGNEQLVRRELEGHQFRRVKTYRWYLG